MLQYYLILLIIVIILLCVGLFFLVSGYSFDNQEDTESTPSTLSVPSTSSTSSTSLIPENSPSGTSGGNVPRSAGLRFKSTVDEEKKRIINSLYRSISRYSSASTQDLSPIVAYLHATYAVAYLYALEDIYPSSEIDKYTGLDHIKFRNELQKNQAIVNKKLVNACPNIFTIPENSSSYMWNIAYLGDQPRNYLGER